MRAGFLGPGVWQPAARAHEQQLLGQGVGQDEGSFDAAKAHDLAGLRATRVQFYRAPWMRFPHRRPIDELYAG